ncbi:hypothetical protein MMO38_05255 [Acinetobacter sp. NIPH 1852]|uniref:hypothetical protein n=1 Tax=Acinetobacter sp. NIPH 1852 TaxID=2923428 RepID=UPI001B3FB09A|nr:hypothetical protein [Acinetobacter sp. NIPH 1852]MBP8005770.1 hypothetical protein [Acinetobacter sp.]MCH7307553.1 hypothetical protein [Acinetobacter sp. NIPH 1852]
MIDALLGKFYKYIILGLLIYIFIHVINTNSLSKKLAAADQKCFTKIQDIERKQVKALADAQNQVNQVSADYEKYKSEQRVKVERVTREVQKIVERPIYFNRCIDNDGVQQINSLIEASNSH